MIRLSQPTFEDEQIAPVIEVLRSGQLVQGKKVKQFEQAMSDYLGAPYVLAVSSGTAALHLALLALGIGKGDAVFVPAFTFPATANVVELVGARTVCVDVDPLTYCMNGDTLRKAIADFSGSEIPKAIIPVHEFGAPAPMDELLAIAGNQGLYVIEDAACALGTKYNEKYAGTLGEIGCFSFHPRKSLTTGEGGLIVTNDEELYKQLVRLRNHGIDYVERGFIDFTAVGLNYRMTEFQAALGTSQLGGFGDVLDARGQIADLYIRQSDCMPGVQFPIRIDGHSWQTFMFVLPEHLDRKTVITRLYERGIETNMGAQAVHMLTYYSVKYELSPEDCPEASRLYRKGLAIPIHDRLSEEDANCVIREVRDVISLLTENTKIQNCNSTRVSK